ncbi:uncharacterized protein LOC126373907 [Pectinophora gossypiella]|uniref:uncharacterized protein LOC126373907 n=1 Tax=Pectinophora gossypiella TaxID=13191 RepID=UPI00214EAC08|nr:uncharacterized protein LOC126373907 [Pectinophora gossypiella]
MKYLTQLAAALAVVTITSTSVVKSPMVTPGDGKLELLILHNNDMHARFEQTSQLSGACTAADREAGKCYGGFPRVAHVVKEARRAAASGEGPPVLYLNAGDTYTGTAWFTIYKWKIAAEFINALQPDAVSLGNNELNAGSSELSPFLENLETNIVATNVIVKGREDKLQKSLVFDIKGVKIGLVGYLALDAKVLDSVGNVEYIDEVIALKEEVTKLQEQNINIIIALGHAGLDKDIEIAREVEGVDLVIAGEKNTFMWNGASAIDQELNEPIEVIQESGKRVPVIRSSAYNTYLGQIYAEFDAFGEITALSVDPIVLDDSVKQDNESVDILNMLHAEFSTRQEEILGQTAVVLDGDSCKYEECNLGNLITDAMVYYHATRFEGEQPWTDASIAIIPADIINASIAPSIRPASITLGDILTVLPVESNIVTVTMNGTILLQVLEHAVSDYDVSSERFLQLSGIRVEYNLENEIGSRVVSAVARCSSCYVPEFYSIDSRSYTVMMPASLANGDYGYSMLVGLPRENLEYDEVTCTAEFIRQRSLVYPEVAGRISLGNHEFDDGVSGLTPFIENLTCPVLAANLNLYNEPTLQKEANLMKSVVFDINGTQVGVIGYLTPETKVLAVRNNVEYIEEIIAIRQEATRLKNTGVKILIALGHSGFNKDLEIAEKVEDIDLVIGGHTNTFLWNGTSPDVENPEGPYPTLVKQASGRQVPVVQAYAYTKYLGKLHLTFDEDGEIVHIDGNPILLDKSIPQDPEVLQIVERYREGVMKISEVVVGSTAVVLNAVTCKRGECSLGNLITDAMVHKYASEYRGQGWTDAPVAIIQRGGIRASIVHIERPANITKGDLLAVMPFDGNLKKVEISGDKILKMLEYAVAKTEYGRFPGQFLHFSGMFVEYDIKNRPGMRVVKASVRCGICDVPMYFPVNRSETYHILMPSFLASGGDGFSSLGNHEFDNGVSGLTPFIETLKCPVLAANLILDKVPELANQTNLKKSIVFDIAGTRIGIIGYLTPETKQSAIKNNVEYIDEITAIQEEVYNLQNDGVNILIALGHSGYDKDQQIAREVEGIDLVIGGHTHSFLWNGSVPDTEESQGPYPTYVTQDSGRIVPVVQAYAYTKYFGKIHLIFDSDGEITFSDGLPILLDKTVPQDPEIVKILERYRKEILNITSQVVGNTSVILDGQTCDKKECNLGNLITDSMIHYYATHYTGEHWTDVPIAMMQAGGIRASVAHIKMPTDITKEDLLAVMPFKGPLATITMNGTILLEMLEHSSLGNHEFDEEVAGVVPFIRNVSAPVLAANLILDSVPEMQEETNLRKSVILHKKGVKIGVIGYLTPDTKFLAPRNKVEYEDEIIALRREVAKLKDQNVKILIALGHSGFIKDLQIAKEVDDLDLVIGGHSNTFLWNSNTTKEKPEYPQGSYPTWVTQASGRKVPVVQAYAYTKYIGKLHLIFDSNGEIIECDGTPILLNQDIPKDPELFRLIEKYRANIDSINNEVVGSSMVFLNGEVCRLRECNIGNVITDAILYYTKKYYDDQHPETYISVVQGGRIRASISNPKEPPFGLTHGDWITVLPFSDTLSIVYMNGTTLLQTLEHSVDSWRKIDTPGQFLQVSGISVTYDLAKPPGSRVVAAQATCSNCTDLEDIRPGYQYNLIMSTFLADTGDGYSMFEGLRKETLPYSEVSCVIEYLKKYSPINPGVYGRVIVLNEDKVNNIPVLTNSNSIRESRLLGSGAAKIYSSISFIALLLLFTSNVDF